jgi:putative transposase
LSSLKGWGVVTGVIRLPVTRSVPTCDDTASHTPFPNGPTRSCAAKPKGPTAAARRALNPTRYRHRNSIERGFNRLKQWRGIATRYDKNALTFLGGLTLAAAITHHRVRN